MARYDNTLRRMEERIFRLLLLIQNEKVKEEDKVIFRKEMEEAENEMDLYLNSKKSHRR